LSLIRRHRLVALIAVVALACSACSRNDAKRSDVVNAMTDAKLNKTQANCIGDGIEKAFGGDQKTFNKVAAATKPEDLPEGAEAQIQSVLDDCLGAQNRSSTTQAGGGSGTTGTTATTVAGGSK
jgi:hypothetical protein